jgi:hypothetical protein
LVGSGQTDVARLTKPVRNISSQRHGDTLKTASRSVTRYIAQIDPSVNKVVGKVSVSNKVGFMGGAGEARLFADQSSVWTVSGGELIARIHPK